METNNDNSDKPFDINYRVLKIVIIVGLFISPVIYLIESSSENQTSTVEQTAVNQSKADIPALENAVNTNPSFDNLINLGMAYINNKMPDKSIPLLQKALLLKPNSAIAYNDLGVAYILLQQYDAGIDACNKAIGIDATFQLAKNNLKWGMDEKNKLESAVKTQEQTPSTKKDVAYYINSGMNYYKIKNYDKAIEEWSKIADIDKKNTTALNNIGSAFMMKKQYDDAIALFKKALEFEPNNQLAKNNLAWGMDEKNKASSIKK